jgi:16S rRNA C967 or C1407 C5-methylase (RsmB/RsmF family)
MRFRFDRVLADVPCSGEGTYRIAPGTRPHRKTPARKRLPELQKSIILRGFDLLKPEGIMIYSTCTYNPDENEGVVDHLIKNREAELIPINIPLKHEQGIVSWRGVKYDEQLRLCARFYPHNVNSVGFFMARIVKRK